MCFPVSSFFGSPLPLSPFSFLWGLSSEVFIWGFISSLPQRAWDKKALLLLLFMEKYETLFVNHPLRSFVNELVKLDLFVWKKLE
jgi:hypothetical protein